MQSRALKQRAESFCSELGCIYGVLRLGIVLWPRKHAILLCTLAIPIQGGCGRC